MVGVIFRPQETVFKDNGFTRVPEQPTPIEHSFHLRGRLMGAVDGSTSPIELPGGFDASVP